MTGVAGRKFYFYLDGSGASGNPRTKFPDNSYLGFGDSEDLLIYS